MIKWIKNLSVKKDKNRQKAFHHMVLSVAYFRRDKNPEGLRINCVDENGKVLHRITLENFQEF